MISKSLLKQILISNQKDIERYEIVPRTLPTDEFPRRVFMGVRRAGKSFMLYQKIQQMRNEGKGWDEMLYLNFEDERLYNFTIEDFNLILECHAEMYGKRPMLFLDEIQNVDSWEKFARRLADSKYNVWITGSNAKMLSAEIMTTLGGRYLTSEVYPYSFCEYLNTQQISLNELSLYDIETKSKIIRYWNEYFLWGGLPEATGLTVKRPYLSSTFQKIYLGDITSRNKISNTNIMRLMIKKMAESIGQPISYNRLSGVLSTISGKVSMPTISKYIEACEAAWLILRLRNMSASFADKETACKYYFVDNGVLNLFLFDNRTALLENMVALALFRKYGHDLDNERVFFFNNRIEIDFYVPEEQLAIQVSYSITQSTETFDREVGALKKLPAILPCSRRIILTYEEEDIISDPAGNIEVIPVWKWLL